MVIDELIVRKGTTNLPIDSYDNQMIDEIVYEGNKYHFAKQKDLVGETSIIADNAVQEPMVSLEVQGNTEQQTYEGYNLFDQNELLTHKDFTKAEYNGVDTIKCVPEYYVHTFNLPKPIPSGTMLSLAYEVAHPETNGNFQCYLYYEDGTTKGFPTYTVKSPTTDFQYRVETTGAEKNVVGVQFNFYDRFEYRPYYFKNIILCEAEKNLYDISKVNGAARANTTTPDVAGHESFGTVTDGILHLKHGVYDAGIIWTGSKIPIKQGGKYNILFDFMCENSMNGSYTYIYISFRNLTKGTSATFATINDDNVRDVWQVKTPQKSIEIPDTWVGDNVYLQLQVAGNSNQYSKMPVYAKNIMISYGEAKPYEPYVGGIASPNPEYPQEIKSCNNAILPSEYKQVEYIESTKTQYIDTGFKPNQNTKVELKCQYISSDTSSIFGSNPYFVLTTYSEKYRFRYNSATIDTRAFGTELAKLTLDKNKAYLNDELVGTFTEATFQSPYNALLFARSTSSGGIEEKCSAKLYYAKLWDNGTLVRDYIPCYRKSDGAIGLYDLANGVFYTNNGTGTFTKGKEIYTMSATIKGVNLLALGESNYTVGKVYTNAGITYTVQADGGIHCKGTKTSSYSYFIFMGSYIRKYGQGTYSLGMYGENIPDKTTIEFRKFNASGTSIQAGMASVGVPVTRTLAEGEILERFSVIVSTEGEVDCVVYPMLNIGEPLPYEPYFNNTIEIPSSVTLADGTELALRFAKQGNKADKLIVDKIGGKVIYEQWVDIQPLPITNATWGISATGNQVKTIRPSMDISLSFSNIDVAQGFLMNKFIETFDATIDEPSFYQATGNLNKWIAIRVDRGLLETQNTAGIKKWLQKQEDEGDPVLIQYAFRNPKTFDLTNTEIGQKLLQVAKTGKGKNVVEITSELPVSKTEMSYWRQIIPNE
jgi:hypothetical protein